MNDTTASTRQAFAESMREKAGIKSPAVISALASVPRERFLGPGPWLVFADQRGPVLTEDADPARVYVNASVAIDRERDLYNGAPGLVAAWFDALAIKPGERVVHIGCGTGYYAAVIAEIVGPTGQVHAIEVDPDLAKRARSCLSPWPWVTISCGDGSELPTDVDVVIVHAGATHILPVWLDCTRDHARLLVPLTVSMPGMSQSLSKGMVLLASRAGDDWQARLTSFIMIYSLAGLRDEAMNQALGQAFKSAMAPGGPGVSRIRRDPHEPGPDCWLHAECCISRA